MTLGRPLPQRSPQQIIFTCDLAQAVKMLLRPADVLGVCPGWRSATGELQLCPPRGQG